MNFKLLLLACIVASIAVTQRRPSTSSTSSTSSLSITPELSSDCGQPVYAPFESSNLYTPNVIRKEDYSTLIPADPISMMIAYRDAQRASVMVPEKKLSFGFEKTPANAEAIKPVPNIPEEKLYTFDRNIVELKHIPCNNRRKVEEEEEEEEEEEKEEEYEQKNRDCGLGYLNYKQLGYYPQKHTDPQFVLSTKFESVSEVEAEPSTSSCNDQEPIQEIGNCGYKPGRIVDDRVKAFEYEGFL